jgi:hypothetical protein
VMTIHHYFCCTYKESHYRQQNKNKFTFDKFWFKPFNVLRTINNYCCPF